MDDVFVDSSIFVTHCMAGDYTLVKLMEKYRLAISERDRRIFYKSLLEKPADTGSWLNKRFESSPLSFDISASIETALNIKLKTAVAR